MSLVAGLAMYAAAGCYDSGGSDPSAMDAAPAAEPSCAAAGGVCGPTPDLPCDSRQGWVARSCPDLRPCCIPLPIPPLGACWDSSDCVAAAAPPGRPASTAECRLVARGSQLEPDEWEPGTCACTAYGLELPDGRCGPALQPGERFLCTVDQRFEGRAGSCDGRSCAAGSACFRAGDTIECGAPSAPALGSLNPQPDPRELCQVVDCGDIRCDAPLRCTDPERGGCSP